MKLYRIALLAGLMTYPAHPLLAEELESVLVTGTYAPVPDGGTSSTVSVLTGEFLRSTNMRSVADALRTVPGLLIEEAGGPGGLTAVSIRGGEANFTLVLVDGVEVNDPTNTRGGSFDFANLDIANIERIEIVRGPESAVYGSDAMAGVINIITRRATENPRQRVRAEWGQDDFRRYSAGATGQLADLGYSLQVAQWDSGEPTEGSERDNDEANVGLHWSPTDKHELHLNYRYLDGKRNSFPEQSGGEEFAISQELDHTDYTDNTLGGSWAWQILPSWHSAVTASHFDHDEKYQSPGISPYSDVPPQRSDTNFTRDQYRWVNSVGVLEAVDVAVGVDYRHEDGDSTGDLDFGVLLPTDFSLDRSSTGVFLGVHARVLPSLLLQGIVRYDDPEDFDSQTTVKLGGEYQLLPTLAVTGNWGEAFKLPSFFALGHALVGNPDLLPETAQSWDVGLKFAPLDTLSVDTTYFENDYRDLIDFDAELFTNVNRRNVETSGVEWQLDWTATTAVHLLAHATYTDIEIKDEGAAPLLGRPDWTAGATALWQISSRWQGTLDYQWTGEQHASSRFTGDTLIETLDDYNRLDINLAWQILDWVSVEVAADNILDENYQTAVGFAGPGRGMRLALVLDNW